MIFFCYLRYAMAHCIHKPATKRWTCIYIEIIVAAIHDMFVYLYTCNKIKSIHGHFIATSATRGHNAYTNLPHNDGHVSIYKSSLRLYMTCSCIYMTATCSSLYMELLLLPPLRGGTMQTQTCHTTMDMYLYTNPRCGYT